MDDGTEHDDLEPKEEKDILESLGRLALAGSAAEIGAATALRFLMTGRMDEEGSSAIAASLRSMDKLIELLRGATAGPETLAEMVAAARAHPEYQQESAQVGVLLVDGRLDEFSKHYPSASFDDYLRRVRALYDKRNMCMHAFRITVDGRMHLQKPSRDGRRTLVTSDIVLEPTLLLRGAEQGMADLDSYKRLPLSVALGLLAFELSYYGRVLPLLAWVFRSYCDAHPHAQ